MPQSTSPSIAKDPQFQQFLTLSADLGQDIERTQGAGGNTSIKQDGIMWVKASGTWLAHALERDIMVPVQVAPLIKALREGDPRAEKATDFVVKDLNTNGLRPSIETSFHAVLPQAVIAHFHCVHTLALVVVERREELIRERMKTHAPGLTFCFVPYRRPGTPLAEAIDAVASQAPDVLFLFNHGIIVTGKTVEETRQRVEMVTKAVATPKGDIKMPPDIDGLTQLSRNTGYRLPTDPAIHETALNAHASDIASKGSLYPDHVIFLGTRIGVVGSGQSIAAVLDSLEMAPGQAPKLLLVLGKGVLLRKDASQGCDVMARCLAEVTTRIPVGETLCYLDEAAEYELTHWEAESYRQALDRANGAAS